ncbi:MAG: amidohydrolase [Candidatus Lokiarchaeota archaeon]|nr:amidohydrolase [Candidatus Lokiarchaeota archaeon]
MAIDCHHHIDEAQLPAGELLAGMDEAGIEKVALMANMCGTIHVSPGLERVGRFLFTHSAFQGMVRKIYNNFAPEGDFIIPGGSVKIYKDPDNRPVFDAVDKHPDRFMGWVFVNPRGDDQLQEFERWIRHPGAVGVKAHPFWHQFAPVDLLPVAEKLAAMGKPMLLHLGFGTHGDYRALLDAVPGLKLVLAHAAFPRYSKAWKEMAALPNVYVDLSSTAYVDEGTMRGVVGALGADRCLFGTDGPFGSRGPGGGFDMGMIKRGISKVFPDEEVQAKILGGNFLRLVGA